MKIRTIIGLEVHVQLRTKTKMFCGCPVKFEAPPNSCVCPVCLGHPGALPVINRQAFNYAVLTALALNCKIAPHTKWDRKSYYYPDMPKNYQISQYDLPLAQEGYFEMFVNGQTKRVQIRRAHLEEDAGKNIHDVSGCTLVDLNRAGTPLLEIVTEPDLSSADDAYAFCTELQRLVVYLGVSEGVMKKGQMRFEPNVNVAIEWEGNHYRTPITEIKNLNSFRAVRDAIAYESQRQVAVWKEDHSYQQGRQPNENRGWNADKGVTEFQRGKETEQDYRYFPDPDLVPVEISDAALDEIRGSLPELPMARRWRLVSEHGLSPEDAETIVHHRATADLFERVIAVGAPAGIVSKQFINVWLRLANDRNAQVTDLGIDADRMAELARITADGTVNRSAASRLAGVMLERSEPRASARANTPAPAEPQGSTSPLAKGGLRGVEAPADPERAVGHRVSSPSPLELAEELGLVQVRDTAATEAWVEQTFAENAKAVQDAIKSPKKAKAAAGFLRGQVMKLSGGKADPNLVGKLVEQHLTQIRSSRTEP